MDVVCLGILIADIFASPIPRLPEAGELALVDRYLMSAGGCAVNTAACLRRLGRKVAVIGKTGQDLLGDFVVKDLTRLGIDASGVRRSAIHATSLTYILNVKGQDRRYLHAVGANSDFSLTDVDLSMLSRARLLNRFGTRCSYLHNDRSDLRVFPDRNFDLVYTAYVLQHMALPFRIQTSQVAVERDLFGDAGADWLPGIS